jgi:hypothetical protein
MLDRRKWQTPGGRTRPPYPISATIAAAALVLALCGAAAAATPSHVVAPNGQVGGKGYSYYLERGWKVFFASPGPCQTVSVGGLRVAVVNPTEEPTCTEPAGRPIYVTGPGAECSTIPGDHNGFGKTASQLEQCARAEMKNSVVHAWLDGHQVPSFARFITATDAFAFRLAKNRFPGVKQRSGRSAAYGYGLLLTGLTKGTHTLRHAGTVNGTQIDKTATLRVR